LPYIKPQDRERLGVEYFDRPRTPGELNYAITLYLRDYFHDNGANYQAINDIVGALEGAKLEFYRRIAAPYEDGKIKENGDVY
jgi:hypothetical protein